MKLIREVAFNVPNGYEITEDRLFGKDHKEWILYVSDYYWILDIDNYLEFYYNPDHCLGKISKSQIPPVVTYNLERECVMFFSNGYRCWHGQIIEKKNVMPTRSDVNFEKLEDNLKIGNWFYAQGYNYVTTNGRFYEICFPYDSYGREWYIWNMKLYDMIRMTCSTKTHHFIKTVWDFKCFQGVDHSAMRLIPFQEGKWDSTMEKTF